MWNTRINASVVLIFVLSLFGSIAEGNDAEILPVNTPADLDLSGEIVYAINFGNNGSPTIGGVVFSQDQDYPEVTVDQTGEALATSQGGAYPDTGDPDLNRLLVGVAYQNSGGNVTTSVNVSGLVVGTEYQLQLICYTDHSRPMDIIVEGSKVSERYDPFIAQGSTDGQGGSMVKLNFTANDDTLNVDMKSLSGDASLISAMILSEVSLTTLSKARKPIPEDGAIHEDTWVNLGWMPGIFAASHDVYFGDNFDNVSTSDESTFQGNQAAPFFVVGFPGFAYPEGLVPGTTYYWRIDEVNDTEPNSPWKGDVWSFTVPPKTAYLPDPADGAASVAPDAKLIWTGGFGSKLHYVYFGDNFENVNNATEGIPSGHTTYDPGPLELEKVYYWRIDEFDAVDTYKGDVWSFSTPGAVGSPNPANGATDVKQALVLEWITADSAVSHEVYLGTDKNTVRNADTGSPEYKGSMDLGSESYDVDSLEWDTTYYWRIDEVKTDTTVQKGLIWSFTTANFLVVDNFESYSDLESNRIFDVWSDGFEDAANGSIVGYTRSPFTEQTIVHSGLQSMPLTYDNSVSYSETTRTLTYPRDWTEKGVNTLTIWFRGDLTNAAELMYVAINGSAVVNHDNPNASQIYTWTQWNVDLQAFADQGVNLTDVNTIAIGIGDRNNPQPGGSGIMYIDDVQLYRPGNVLSE